MSGAHPQAVCFTYWLSGHNTARYAMLFPQLASIVRVHKFVFDRRRVVSAIQWRAWRVAHRRLVYPVALRVLQRRYRTLFTLDPWQVPHWKGSVIVDVCDPWYNEIALLNLPQVQAIVVTNETAKETYRALGVNKPIFIIPCGVPLQTDTQRVQRVRAEFRADGDIVAGYHAPTLTLSRDGRRRFRQGMDDLDFLCATVEDARRVEPRITLWLVGRASASVKAYAAARPWVRVIGYVPLAELLDYVACFDIGVYPRTGTLPPGRLSYKMAQYMACRVPIVSTAVAESFLVREAACGIICDSQPAFSEALVKLARSPAEAARFGMAGRAYAEHHFDWARLIPYYEQIIRDALGSQAGVPAGGPTHSSEARASAQSRH